MARPLRIEYPGAWYHVMNRGVCRREIFHTEEYAQLFYEILEEIHERYQIEIHAFCLMGNHYHLCIRTRNANLGKVMQQINGVFTQRYNHLIKGDGPLFKGRYKAILIEAENYFLKLTRYIHLNPVAAGIVKNPKDYLWSSYRYLFNETGRPPWLYFDETLKYFDKSDPVIGYEKFVLEGTDIETKSFFDKAKPFPILGSGNFVQKIKERFYQSSVIEIPDSSKVANHGLIAIEDIIYAVKQYYNVGTELLSVESTKKLEDTYRKVGIYLSVQLSGKSQTAVAKHFNNISYPWVSKIYRNVLSEIKTDFVLFQEICHIKASLYKIKI